MHLHGRDPRAEHLLPRWPEPGAAADDGEGKNLPGSLVKISQFPPCPLPPSRSAGARSSQADYSELVDDLAPLQVDISVNICLVLSLEEKLSAVWGQGRRTPVAASESSVHELWPHHALSQTHLLRKVSPSIPRDLHKDASPF